MRGPSALHSVWQGPAWQDAVQSLCLPFVAAHPCSWGRNQEWIRHCGRMLLGNVASSRKLHTNLLERILRLPMSFFDSQPSGRLLNRFSRDTESLDTNLIQVTRLSCLVCCWPAQVEAGWPARMGVSVMAV